MLRLCDDHGDDVTLYIVHRDGNEIINTIKSCGIDKVTIGEYSITSCAQGYSFLVEYFH